MEYVSYFTLLYFKKFVGTFTTYLYNTSDCYCPSDIVTEGTAKYDYRCI